MITYCSSSVLRLGFRSSPGAISLLSRGKPRGNYLLYMQFAFLRDFGFRFCYTAQTFAIALFGYGALRWGGVLVVGVGGGVGGFICLGFVYLRYLVSLFGL